uniref:Translin-associated factor X-interacting protein 1 N-terminal domain-containing protein n=1 Tax=Oncorhynchus tshawytscha TaxID=74940 RepID=A0A8C8H9L0_ONCTS
PKEGADVGFYCLWIFISAAYLRDQIRELEPLRARLVVVSEQCEKRILGLREEERVEIRALKQERQHRQKVIENMRETQSSLQTQVQCLPTRFNLAAQYLMYREECDARKLLIANISSMSYGPDEEPEEEQEVEIEDPVKEKLALKVCREDLTKAQVELNRLHAEYGDVVPRRDWETLDHTHKENLLKVQFSEMFDSTTARDSLQGELEGFKEASTPRPEWEQCADVLGGSERWADLSQGQSSQRRLEILLAELGGKNSEFFTGLGTSDDVPIYLRYEGQLKNHRLKKNAVVRILKEVWKEKVMEDGRRMLNDVNLYRSQFAQVIYLFHCCLKSVNRFERITRGIVFFIHREVTVADLRAAFKNIDPSLDAITLDWVLTMAFQIHQGELEQHTTQMDTELALQHLLAIDVTRAGPRQPYPIMI